MYKILIFKNKEDFKKAENGEFYGYTTIAQLNNTDLFDKLDNSTFYGYIIINEKTQQKLFKEKTLHIINNEKIA